MADDYGLSELSDDQLIELMRQTFAELCQRDPVIGNLANQAVNGEVERFQLSVQACAESIKKGKRALEKELREESYAELRKLYDAGELSLLSPEEEAKLVAQSTAEAYIRLIDEEEKNLTAGKNPDRFFFEMDGPHVLVGVGDRQVRAKTPIPRDQLVQVLSNIRAILGA